MYTSHVSMSTALPTVQGVTHIALNTNHLTLDIYINKLIIHRQNYKI